MSGTIEKPLVVGVFGGSFNPVHLGHGLLAITTQQTKNVDSVVLVPVYKHAVKKDLLPFEDRVNMCKLAVAGSSGIEVSTIERDVGESNGAMLRGLKKEYPVGTKFLWICGDDFFRWMDRPKGLETLREVSGIIVQRRLHREAEAEGKFYKEPLDEAKLRSVAEKMKLDVDFIYGELPHFSSTLVRRAPGNWRSFLTQSVTQYLDERPHLLQQLIANLEADAKMEQSKVSKPHRKNLDSQGSAIAADVIMHAIDMVHALQNERGRAGLWLSMGSGLEELREAQCHTDGLLRDIMKLDGTKLNGYDEGLALASELKRVALWLEWDRLVMGKRFEALTKADGTEGWLARWSLIEKFNSRIVVLYHATIRALTEILEVPHSETGHGAVDRDLPDLLLRWWEGKENLGRLRAFVCSGGPSVPLLVRGSLKMRQKLNQTIETKERSIARVLELEAGMPSRLAAPDALHRMLENVAMWEFTIMGSFSSSTPLPLVHKLLGDSRQDAAIVEFDVLQFFEASSAAIDFILTFAKALAASLCASA